MTKINTNHNSYIYKNLKKVHLDVGISSNAINMMTSLINDMISKIIRISEDLMTHNMKKTITQLGIETAVKLTFPGELREKSLKRADKALIEYKENLSSGSGKMKLNTRSSKAGLILSISRFENIIRMIVPGVRINSTVPVYLAGILEFLITEILYLSGATAKDNRRKRIIPRHIFIAINYDPELTILFKKTVFGGSGVIPVIHRSLMPVSKKPSKKSKTPNKKFTFSNPEINGSELTKSAIKRLSFRAGVKYLSKPVYDIIRDFTIKNLTILIDNTYNISQYKKSKTLLDKDLILALKFKGYSLLNEEPVKTSVRKAKKPVVKPVKKPVVKPVKKPVTKSTKKVLPSIPVKQETKSATKQVAKSAKKPKTKPSTSKNYWNRPVRRFRKGTVALRSITRFQKTTELLIPKASFIRLVKKITKSLGYEIRFQKNFLFELQDFIEYLVVFLFQNAVLLTIHAGRQLLMLDDILLADKIIDALQ